MVRIRLGDDELDKWLRVLEAFKAMAKRNVNRELDQFLNGHGYHHSGRKQKSSNAPAAGRAAPLPPKPPEDPVALVLRTAQEMESEGRFAAKVYIAAIWDAIGSQLGMSLPEFKRWLLEQNRRGTLLLARADLMGAMNRQMVTRSEIQDRGSTFHFVLDPRFASPY
jgi:hypothetical protein